MDEIKKEKEIINSFKEINHDLKYIRKKVSSKTERLNLDSKNNKEKMNYIYNKYNSFKKIEYDKGKIKRRLTHFYNSRKSKLKFSYELIKSEIKEQLKVYFKNIPSSEETRKNLIKSIKITNYERTQTDILNIKNFLINSQVLELFKFTNSNEEIIEKLLIHCIINIKHKFIKKDTILYKINDIVDNFYIIINGNIGIYKPFNKIIYMSGFKYFEYIYDIYIKKENYLLKLALEQNSKMFPIKEEMVPNLNINVAAKLIEKYKKNPKDYINIFNSVEDILKKCFINPIDYINNNIANNSNNDNFNYDLLCRIDDQNIVYIFEYHLLHEYIDGKYLDSINTQKFIENYNLNLSENYKNNHFSIEERRIYTAKILSNSHLCYFDLNSYYNFLLSEYKIILHRDSKFLIDNFIFKSISKQFEEKYFPFFKYEEININHYLFTENQPLEYIYFLKDGIVELTINKNTLQINYLLENLNLIRQNKEENKNKNIKKNFNLNFKIDKTFSSKKEEKRLIIFEEKDNIGMECLYFGIDYFYSAKTIQKKGIFYKIKKDKFLEILELEKESGIEKKYINECERKIDYLILRLFNLQQVKYNLIQNKKIKNVNDIKNKENKENKENKKDENNNKIIMNYTHKNNKKIVMKKITELFDKRNNNFDKIENKFNLFANSFISDKNKKFFSPNKKSNNSKNNLKKIYIKINNQINSRNQNSLKINTKNRGLSQSPNNINDNSLKPQSFYNKRITGNDSLNNFSENKKTGLSELIKTPKIKKKTKSCFSIKSEKYLLNKVKKKRIYDDLFINNISDINSNINININNLRNNELYLKFKDKNNNYLKKNLSNINEFVPWKYFHYNINIELISNKKKIMKNNWYKNIDKLSKDNHDNDYSSINNWIYGIKNARNNVKLIRSNDFFRNTNSLST